MQADAVETREIRPGDNKPLAELIKGVFKEFELDIPGTVYADPTTDHLFELFTAKGSVYLVATINNQILGGCGIFPTTGLPENCAELVKLYVSPSARGNKIGYTLLSKSIEEAKKLGYKSLYLESFPRFLKAIELYRQMGFEALSHPLGNSGHFACNVWMYKNL